MIVLIPIVSNAAVLLTLMTGDDKVFVRRKVTLYNACRLSNLRALLMRLDVMWIP